MFNWRHQYDQMRDARERAHTDINCEDESLTQQHFRDDADINVLAHRYGLDKGPMPNIPVDPAYYGDFTNVPDLRAALDMVHDAQERFMQLDPKLRARFHNQPGELWQFVNDPDNGEEAIRLGLLARPAEPAAPPPIAPAIATKQVAENQPPVQTPNP